MRRIFSKVLPILILSVVLVCSFGLSGCKSYTKRDKEYWFTNTNVQFVPYEKEKENLSEAGTYWTMEVKQDCKITISIRGNSLTMYSGTYFYVNEEQVKADASDFYDFVYADLELKKAIS